MPACMHWPDDIPWRRNVHQPRSMLHFWTQQPWWKHNCNFQPQIRSPISRRCRARFQTKNCDFLQQNSANTVGRNPFLIGSSWLDDQDSNYSKLRGAAHLWARNLLGTAVQRSLFRACCAQHIRLCLALWRYTRTRIYAWAHSRESAKQQEIEPKQSLLDNSHGKWVGTPHGGSVVFEIQIFVSLLGLAKISIMCFTIINHWCSMLKIC